MSFSATVYITSSGYNLMASALAGDELSFTRFGVGDGDLPSGTSENQMTALTNEVLSVDVQSVVVEDNVASVKGVITSGDAAIAFDFKELGLWARLNGGAEVLVAYGNCASNSEYIDLDTTYSIIQKLIDVKIPVSGLASVSLSVSAQGYALQSDLVLLQNRVTTTESDIATNATNIQTNTDSITAINNERVVKKFKTLYEAQRLADEGDVCVITGRNANKANWVELCNALTNYQTYSGFTLPSTDAFRIFDIKDDIILFESENASNTYLVAIQFDDDDFSIKYGCHIKVTDTYPVEAGIVSFDKTYYIVLRYDEDGSNKSFKTRVLPFPYGWGDSNIPDITWGQLMQTGFCLCQKGKFPLAVSYNSSTGVPDQFNIVPSVTPYPSVRRLAIDSFTELDIPYNNFTYAEPLFITQCGDSIFMGIGTPTSMSYLQIMCTRSTVNGDHVLAPPIYSEVASTQLFNSTPITFFPRGGAVVSDSGTLYTFGLTSIDSSRGYLVYGNVSQSPYQIGGTTPSTEYVHLSSDWISWKMPDMAGMSSDEQDSFVISAIPSTGINAFSFNQRKLEIGSSPIGISNVSWRSPEDLSSWSPNSSTYPTWSKYGLTYLWCDTIFEYSEDSTPEAIVLFPTHTDGGVYRKCGGVIQYLGETL